MPFLSEIVYFTVDGGEFVCHRPANPNRATGNSLNVINLNGGVFSAWNLARANSDASYTGKPEAYVNFNGGTYRAIKDYPLFGTKGGGAWANAVDRVTVFEKGATIDVPQNLTGVSVDVPMDKPSGKGVTYIPWNDTTTEFVGAPFVDIVKDEGASGWGATAMAVYDPDTRHVTAIRITSPGCGYETGRVRAHIVYPGSRTWTNEVTLAENATTGSFTKKGAGMLVMKVANTYGDDTVIEDGTLHVMAEGAIPEGSSIVMKGGTLSAAGVTLPAMNFKFVLGETFASAGSIVFPEGSTITVDNLASLDPEAREYVLATYEKGVTGTAEFLQEADLPSGWKFRIGAKKIKISRSRGTLAILR